MEMSTWNPNGSSNETRSSKTSKCSNKLNMLYLPSMFCTLSILYIRNCNKLNCNLFIKRVNSILVGATNLVVKQTKFNCRIVRNPATKFSMKKCSLDKIVRQDGVPEKPNQSSKLGRIENI